MPSQLADLAADESTWRMERGQFAELNNKLESVRTELSREREENIDLRRKLSATKDAEFELRAEREKRQTFEAKLVEAEKDSAIVRDLQMSLSTLRLDKQTVCVPIVLLLMPEMVELMS